MTKDPLGPHQGGDINPYRYALNNPVNFVDPMGTDTLQIGVAYNITAGPVAFQGGGGLAFDTQGGVAVYSYAGGAAGAGLTTGYGLSVIAANLNL